MGGNLHRGRPACAASSLSARIASERKSQPRTDCQPFAVGRLRPPESALPGGRPTGRADYGNGRPELSGQSSARRRQTDDEFI